MRAMSVVLGKMEELKAVQVFMPAIAVFCQIVVGFYALC
jgi:hypothetical protein